MTFAPRRVSRSGAPGPAPTNDTRPRARSSPASAPAHPWGPAATAPMSHRVGSDRTDVTSVRRGGVPESSRASEEPRLGRRTGTIRVDKYGMSGMFLGSEVGAGAG